MRRPMNTSAISGMLGKSHVLKHRKLLYQIFISNIIIALMVSILQFIYSMSVTSNYIKNNYIYSSQSNLTQLTNSYDKYLHDIYTLQSLLSSKNNNLSIFPNASGLNDSDIYLWMNNFSSFMGGYEFIDSCWIYNGNYVLDTSSGLKKQTEFRQWSTLSNLISNGIKNYSYMIPYISQPRDKEDSYFKLFSVVSPMFPEDKGYIGGCIVFNINANELTKKNTALMQKDTDHFYIYSKNRDEIVMTSDNAPSELDAKLLGANLSRLNENNNYVRLKLNNQNYVFIAQRSEYNPDWMYVYLSSTDDYGNALNKVIGSFILFLSVIILVELIISWFVSLFIYEPINQMTKNISSLPIGTPSDEVSVINSHIAELQESIEEKRRLLGKALPVVGANILLQLFQDRMKGTAAIAEFDKYGMSFTLPNYCILLFFVDNYLYYDTEQQLTIADEIKPVIDEICSANINNISTRLGDDCIGMLANSENELSQAVINRISSQINDALMKKSGTTATICISASINNIDNIPRQLKTVQKNIDERFSRFGYGSVIYPGLIQDNTPENSTVIDSKTEGMIIYMLSHNSSEKEQQLLDRLSEILTGSTSHIVRVYYRIFDIIQRNIDSNIIDIDQYRQSFDKIVRYATREDAFNMLSVMFGEICSSEKLNNTDSVGKKIKQYVDENYSSDLSLQRLSDVFRLSSAYISNIFKAENGIGFIEYVNEVRIDKSKYLLANSDMSINLICEKVGFTTYTSFARVFKNTVGMSAKEYRTKYSNHK